MPLINVRTSLPEVGDSTALLKELSAALAQQTGKPESYVMTLLETAVPMTFAGSSEPCAYVEIKSIGALKPAAMTSAFCELIESSAFVQRLTHFLHGQACFGGSASCQEQQADQAHQLVLSFSGWFSVLPQHRAGNKPGGRQS